MKRIISFLLILCIFIALPACSNRAHGRFDGSRFSGGKHEKTEKQTTTTQPVQPTQSATTASTVPNTIETLAPATQQSEPATQMSSEDHYRINIFLSNFSEQFFDDFDSSNYDESQLVRFSYLHYKINFFSSMKIGSGYYSLTLEQVNQKLQRYFGLSVSPTEGQIYETWGWSISYANGYFSSEAAEGESYSYMSVADTLKKRSDGNYDVTFKVYSVDKYAYGGMMIEDKSYYYMTPEEAASRSGLTYIMSGKAVVRRYISGAVDSYQLISYHTDN